jgi:uncharacterized damage-inducible protein DinB
MTEVTAKTQLIHMLEVSNQRVIDWFTAISPDDFFIRYGEVWSPSDNVDHLIKAHEPVAQALRLPKIALRAMFGKPDRSSMSYEKLCQAYREEIANGAQASGRYLPDQGNLDSHSERKKAELLDHFAKVSSGLVASSETWNDSELDDYLLPHPILGKLTIREILFFTVYHNLRHASQEGD